jgi:hypothetical protein
MKQTILVFPLFLFTALSVFSQKTIRRNVYFETNQSQLSSESQGYLRLLTDSVKKYATYTIELKGHTDADGSDDTNQKLSEKRIGSVKSVLEKNGILQNNITITAFGEKTPLAENTTVEGKQRNRCVEMLITFYPPNTNLPALASSNTYQSILQLYKDLGQTPQYFKINTGRDTTITGQKGTILFIPKNAFQGAPINAIVDFRLKEAYSFADIVAENLNTHSSDKLLQTGGMFYADAFYNGQSLALKNNLKVTLPTKESKLEGMQLFTGERDMKNNGRIDWNPINKFTGSDRFDEESLTIYSSNTGFNPYLLTNKKGALTFKQIIDTTHCSPLLTRKQFENSQKGSVKIDKLSNTGLALSLFNYYKPTEIARTTLQTHREAFDDVYTFYNVNSLSELKQKDGKGWDSIMQVRLKLITDYNTAQQRRDSLVQEAKKFNSTFELPKLGWVNCDRFTSFPSSSLVLVQTSNLKPDINNNIIMILKRDKLALSLEYSSGTTAFPKVPQQLDAYVVGMKIENGKPYLAINTITTADMKVNLDFKQLSPEDIKQQLKMLDK